MEKPPQIDTPIIDMQDLEHQANEQTRVNDAGIEVLPQINLSGEDEEARRAIEALELLVGQDPPL